MMPAPAALDAGRRRRRRPSSPDALTPRRLEVLVRLHGRGLDGAGAELLDALDTRRDELAAALGMASTQLPMPGGHEQVPRLMQLIESRLAAARAASAESRLGDARALADKLAAEAIQGFDGIELEQPVLAELARTTGFDDVAFRVGGEIVGLPRAFLGALLREVGGVTLTSLRVVPADHALRIGYRGARCTGSFRLRLEPPDTKRTCVVIDLDAARVRAATDELNAPAAYSPAHTAIDPRPRGPFADLSGGAP